MRKAIIAGVSLVLFGSLVAPPASPAATQRQACRKAVGKTIASLYQATLKGTQGCYKTRIATSGATTDCLDPAQFDPGAKLANITSALAATMSTSGTCGPLGAQFAPSCSGAPAACATACGSCGTGAAVAACLACRVVELTKTQVAGLYGNPPDLSADPAARTCQNALGAETAKYGRTRIKAQQKCQQAVDADKLRTQCADADRGGKIAKAGAKGLTKMLGKCLPAGGDQIPSLDAAAACLVGGTAASATACALTSADTAADGIFTLTSKPASASGYVMTAGPDGALVPLPGVRIELVGGAVGRFTDQHGFYELQNVPPGNPLQLIAIDGQRVGAYPRIAMGVAIGMVGETAMGIFAMPEIDMANAVDIGPMTTINPNGSRTLNVPVTLTNPTLPGAALDLTPGTVLTFDVPNRAPLLSISMVPTNVMPFPPGVYSDEIYSFQPEGTTLVPPANVTFPNNSGLGALSSIDIYVPDFATNSFFLAGTGTVSPDAMLVESDGPIIGNFDWHFPAPPSGCLTDVIGRVVDGSSVPIGGATVLAVGAGATSAADGTFSMPGLPCPTFVQATAAFAPPNNAPVLVGLSAQTPTVFSGVTNVGDIVLGPPLCGNGTVNPPEQCDDGHNTPRDGCSPTCLYELCGNSTVDPGEECDSTPGCTRLCTLCGDGLLRIPGEECDDGALNGTPNHPCSAGCFIAICGNGIVEDGEECDDGAANGGEFCDDGCRIDIDAADGFFFSAVRAMLGCGNIGGPTPNDTTSGGVPSCVPPPLDSPFQFGPSGVGTFTASFASDGSDIVVAGHLEDVRTAGDVPIADASGWRLRATVRLTLLVGPSEGTLIDQTLTAAATLGDPGELNAGIPVASMLGVSFAPYTIHNLEVVNVAMLDPSDAEFASRGVFVTHAPPLVTDTPASAPLALLGMAAAYVSCGNPGGNAPNATINGIPSCAPPETFHDQAGSPSGGWIFGPGAIFAIRANANDDDVVITGVANGIRDEDGPSNGFGTLGLTLRSTVRDPGGEMTIIDFPVGFQVKATDGKFKFKLSLNALLQGIGQPPLPAAEISLVTGELMDPTGNAFTKLGIADGY